MVYFSTVFCDRLQTGILHISNRLQTDIYLSSSVLSLTKLLANGESIQQAYEIFRDLFIFTDKRLILADKQGITGKKTQYHSIPYKSIRHFSIETAGHFDLDAELKIYVAGMDMPISKKFDKSLDIYQLQAILAEYVLR